MSVLQCATVGKMAINITLTQLLIENHKVNIVCDSAIPTDGHIKVNRTDNGMKD